MTLSVKLTADGGLSLPDWSRAGRILADWAEKENLILTSHSLPQGASAVFHACIDSSTRDPLPLVEYLAKQLYDQGINLEVEIGN